jgi:transcriptional regulator with XRE-family HTH domain
VLVRKLRLQRGWTQDQVAEMAGVSVRTIQRLERGDPPSLETAKALASVFEVQLSSFHHEDPAMMHSPDSLRPAAAARNAEITPEETAALVYAKRVKEFYQGIFVYVFLAVIFFATFGFHEPVVYWAFGGAGIGLVVHGLLAFEKIRLPSGDWEKRIAEKRLGRKL